MILYQVKNVSTGDKRSIKHLFFEKVPENLKLKTKKRQSQIAFLRQNQALGPFNLDKATLIDFTKKELKLGQVNSDSILGQLTLHWDQLSIENQEKLINLFSNSLQLQQLINPFDDEETNRILKEHMELGISHLSELSYSDELKIKLDTKTELVMKEWSVQYKKKYDQLSDEQLKGLRNELKNKMKVAYLLQQMMMTNQYFSRSLRYYDRDEIKKLSLAQKTQTAFEAFLSTQDKTYCTPNSMMFVSLFRLLGVNAHFNLPKLEENKLFYLNEITHANISVPVGHGFSFVLEPQDVTSSYHKNIPSRIIDSFRSQNKRDRSLSYFKVLSHFYSDYAGILLVDIKNRTPQEIIFIKNILDLSLQMDAENEMGHRHLGAYYLNFEKNSSGLLNAEKHLLKSLALNNAELTIFNNLIKVYWQQLKLSPERKSQAKIIDSVKKQFLGRAHVLALNLETLRDQNDMGISKFSRQEYFKQRVSKIAEHALSFLSGLDSIESITYQERAILFLKLVVFLNSLKPTFAISDIRFEGKLADQYRNYFLTKIEESKKYLGSVEKNSLDKIVDQLIEDKAKHSGLKILYHKYLKEFTEN